MGLENYITDIATDKKANVVTKNGRKPNGLVTYTEPRQDFYSISLPFSNDTYGANLNVDASTSGIALPVHNGNDTPLWTGSNITGTKVNFSSTNQAYTGTQSIEFNGMNNGDVAQIANGAPVVLTGNYVSITFAVYVDSNWSAGDDIVIYGYDTVGGVQVGTSVSFQNYFDRLNTGVWQLAQIPLADMNLLSSTIDSFRIQVVATQAAKPLWYLDIIELQAASGSQPIKYTVVANNNTIYYKDSFLLEIANDIPSTLASNSMPALAYDSFLGVTITNGIQVAMYSNNKLLEAFVVKNISDLIGVGFIIENNISDGTNTYITLKREFKKPILCDSIFVDCIAITINDDLSSLLKFRALSIGYEERFFEDKN